MDMVKEFIRLFGRRINTEELNGKKEKPKEWVNKKKGKKKKKLTHRQKAKKKKRR